MLKALSNRKWVKLEAITYVASDTFPAYVDYVVHCGADEVSINEEDLPIVTAGMVKLKNSNDDEDLWISLDRVAIIEDNGDGCRIVLETGEEFETTTCPM